jgi:hypothetical protein
VFAQSGQTTRTAGSARLVVSYSGSAILSGAANLRNETAVLDDHSIFGADRIFQPLRPQEADALGISEKRWVKTDGHQPLVEDPFIPDLKSFFDLLAAADDVRFLGYGEERGVSVRRYSARLGREAFLNLLPPTMQDFRGKPGTPYEIKTRDYFDNYFGWDKRGEPIELAVDSRGRVRRANLALPSEPLAIQFYDFGVAVNVTPPSAPQVIASEKYERLKSAYCSDPARQERPRKPPCQ